MTTRDDLQRMYEQDVSAFGGLSEHKALDEWFEGGTNAEVTLTLRFLRVLMSRLCSTETVEKELALLARSRHDDPAEVAAAVRLLEARGVMQDVARFVRHRQVDLLYQLLSVHDGLDIVGDDIGYRACFYRDGDKTTLRPLPSELLAYLGELLDYGSPTTLADALNK